MKNILQGQVPDSEAVGSYSKEQIKQFLNTKADVDDDGKLLESQRPSASGILCSDGKTTVEEALDNLRPGVNLLDNWYFADPINQMGQTEYTSGGYTIDRWYTNARLVEILKNDCIKITNANNGGALWWLLQVFDQNRFLPGTILTVSALVKADPTIPFSIELQSSQTVDAWSGYASVAKTGNYELVTYTTTLASFPSGNVGFGLVTHENANTGNFDYIEAKAMKVELGSVQTLAHQDADGNWVLNDPPPNKALELVKCMRYYQIFATQSLRPTDKDDFRPPMRINPILGTIIINDTTYYTADANL